MGPFEKFVRSTKTFKKVVGEYSRITERNFEIIKIQDESTDHLQDHIQTLNRQLEAKCDEIDALIARYAKIPDAATHMKVVSECERLKFLNTGLEDELRMARQELFSLKNPGILKPVAPKLTVRDVVVLEKIAPVKKTTKATKTTKAKKAPKLARGKPSPKRRR